MELEERLGEASCHLEALAEGGADLVPVLVFDGFEECDGLRDQPGGEVEDECESRGRAGLLDETAEAEGAEASFCSFCVSEKICEVASAS